MKTKIIISILFIVIYIAVSSSAVYAQANSLNKTVKPALGVRMSGTPSGIMKPPVAPAVRIAAAVKSINMVADKLSSLSAKLENRINEAKNNGKDTASLETLLSNMKTNIQNAKTAVSVIPVEVATKEGLRSAKTSIQSALQNLRSAAQDARKIIVFLLTMSVGNNSTTGNSSSASSLMKPGVVNQ